MIARTASASERQLAQSAQVATSVVLDRLVDILLVQLLRAWLVGEPPDTPPSMLGALRDPRSSSRTGKGFDHESPRARAAAGREGLRSDRAFRRGPDVSYIYPGAEREALCARHLACRAR